MEDYVTIIFDVMIILHIIYLNTNFKYCLIEGPLAAYIMILYPAVSPYCLYAISNVSKYSILTLYTLQQLNYNHVHLLILLRSSSYIIKQASKCKNNSNM